MFLYSRTLGAIPSVAHGFSDDRGPWNPQAEAMEAFWRELATPLGFESHGVARLHQVHGRKVVEVREGGDAGEGDALFCREPGVLLAIRTADCVPILVAGTQEVAAVHAGWRGLVAGVIEATIERFQDAPLSAVIGPCICVEHYEVGSELVAALEECGVPREVCTRDDIGPRPHVDLRAAAAWKLEQQGIPIEQVEVCTWADQRFPSYRRNGPLSGRMASVIGLQC